MSIMVPRETAEERMSICNDCDSLFKPTKTCKECGCFMSIKVWGSMVECPLGKWQRENNESSGL